MFMAIMYSFGYKSQANYDVMQPITPVGIGKDDKPGTGRGEKGYGFDIIHHGGHVLKFSVLEGRRRQEERNG